ncbi:hypothetical protein [Paracoccus aestuariivivens]|uniref:Uncharacterized protein n=1 Tax=Paracoccus aestuariivivens TaxID=1820333 RepID=A0A6L6JHR7_9RHOB|nr:hypothetical protein [Paracoccus aestuariivivens]MTH79431.1 hypothetical protein [Paracoccus aestuariivivens]
MTSWDFAADYPELTESDAERLIRAHGHDPDEVRQDLGERFTLTAELFAWLGY